MISKKNQELKMLASAADEFSKKMLGPALTSSDQYPFGPFPWQLLEKAYELDFFHPLLPEPLGGMGMGIRALCHLLRPICRVDASFGGIVFTTTFAYDLLMRAAGLAYSAGLPAGDEDVKAFLIAAPVFDNPSDQAPGVSAHFEHDRYVLTGLTECLALGNIAERGLIPAKICGHPGFSYFHVELDQRSVSIGEPVLSLGMHACPVVDVRFHNATGHLIGEEHRGEAYFQETSNRFLSVVGAMALGVMEGAFGEACTYARKRKQGGKAIMHWSELQMMLSDMALKIKMAEMAVAHSSAAVDEGLTGWRPASLAVAAESSAMACAVTNNGIQVLGGAGYMQDFGQEKRFRDARHIQTLLGAPALKKLRFLKHVA